MKSTGMMTCLWTSVDIYFIRYIPDQYTDKDGKQSQIQDYRQTKLLLQKIKGKKILFLDHYKLNVLWQKNISTSVNKLIVIQDEIKKNYCDYYINENFFIKKPDTKNLKITKIK